MRVLAEALVVAAPIRLTAGRGGRGYRQHIRSAHSLSKLNDDFTYVSSAWADDWLARGAELVEKYHPDIVYFDWWIGQASIRPNLSKFAAFYYNSSLKYGDHVGVVNYKDYAMQEHSAVLDVERGQLATSVLSIGRPTLL